MSKYNLPMELGENTIPGKIMRKITPDSTVLEFGCAEGRMTRYMQEKLGCKVYIVEVDQDAYETAVSFAQAGVCTDAELMTWQDAFAGVTFDYILFADVLEHLHNPEKVLKCAGELLKEDGSILVSIPNICHSDVLCNLYQNHFQYTELGLLDNTHIHFWGADDFVKFAADVGLQVRELDGVSVPFGKTEQNPNLLSLPIDLEVLLWNRPYGDVYQFLFELKKAEQFGGVAENLVSKIVQVRPAKVYWDTGRGFNEQETRAVEPYITLDQRYIYAMDDIPEHCKALRLDPVEGQSVYLQGVSAVGDCGELLVEAANGIVTGNGLMFTNTDPQVLVCLSMPCRRVKIEVRNMLPICSQQVREFLQSAYDTCTALKEEKRCLSEELKSVLEIQKQMQDRITRAEKEYAALAQLAETRREQLHQTEESAHRQLRQLRESHERTLSQLQERHEQEQYQIQEEYARQSHQKDERIEVLKEQREEFREREAKLNATLKKMSADSQVLVAQLQQEMERSRQIEEQYAAISDAQCWKLTAPIRKILDVVKRTEVGKLTHKAARCVRMFGWQVTLKKIRHYLQRSRLPKNADDGDKCFETIVGFIQAAKDLGGQAYGDFSAVQMPESAGKRILLVSHELNLTGAPVALSYLAISLKKQRYFPIVVAPRDGALRETMGREGIPVIVLKDLYQSKVVLQSEALFEAIIVSTIVGAPIICQLSGKKIPVMWWIHEAYASYHPEALAAMPERLESNIFTYCGGPYAASVLKQYRPEYSIRELLYYVPDYAAQLPETLTFQVKNRGGKMVFALVGMQEERKGQDILTEAIRNIDPSIRENCLFLFVGRRHHIPIREEIDSLRSEYPENVQWIEELGRDELTSLYMQMDCLVCASKDDPMPIVVTEAMLMSKIIICSENAGSAALLEQLNAGLIYRKNDPQQLAKCLEHAYLNRNNLIPMQERARKTYERFFSQDAFDSAVCGILQEMHESRGKLLAYDGTVSVVIPTYNAGAEMKPLIELLNAQENIGHVEIVIVDSGSRDGTAETAESLGAVVIRIPQAEFSHSHARNLGAERATGEYLLFMTQDAVPDGTLWICKLLQPALKQGVVGISCGEKPKPGCDLLGRISIWGHSEYMGILSDDRILSMPKQANYESLRRNGQLNDVTCLLKKSIFEQFWYRGDYAEDLDLGIRLIRAGYRLALLSSVQVIHSHTRPAIYHLKRSLVDVSTLQKILPDMPVDRVDQHAVMNRAVTGYCVAQAYVDYIEATCDVQETAETFCQRMEQFFQQTAAELRNARQEAIEKCLYRKSFYYDEELAKLLFRIWSICKSEFQCDVTLAGDLIYFITHTIPRYLEQTGQTLDASMKQEISGVIFKRYGQLAGGLFAAYGLTHTKENNQFSQLIGEYWAGV